MIHKYAGKLFAYCLCQKDCCYRGIHTAGQCTEHLTVSYLFTDLLDRCLYERIHLPIALAVAYLIYEIGKHLHTFLCMHNLRMELYCIKSSLGILHCRYRTYWCVSCYLEICRCCLNIICMAHPADRFF